MSLADWRQRSAWLAAAEHLNAYGMAAAVPEDLVWSLRRRGCDVWARQAAS
jgi:hypothetical protein